MSREIDQADFELGIKVCNLQHAIRPQQREQIVKSQNYVGCKILMMLQIPEVSEA